MKWWRKDTKRTKEDIGTPEANIPDPPTRAEQLFDLFVQWGKNFEWEGLQGAWIDTGNEQVISIAHGEQSILWVSRIWAYGLPGMFTGKIYYKPQTLVFDEEFGDQLDCYIIALEQAVEQKQHRDDWLRQKAKERVEFEISRF